jgi:hypothetical protein
MEDKYLKYKNKNIKLGENINQIGGINVIPNNYPVFSHLMNNRINLPSINEQSSLIEMIFRR